MTDTASDIVVSRLLRKIENATPEELPELTREFARLKPPSSPQLGDDYISPEKKVIAKIVSQDDKQQALFELMKLANLGAANPDDAFGDRHSLSVPAAQAWSMLVETLPDPQARIEAATEAMTFAKVDVMKDVAAVALLQSLERAPILGSMHRFLLTQIQDHAFASQNGLLKMMIRDFQFARIQAFAAENARHRNP